MHNSQTDRQTDPVAGWAEQCLSISPRQTDGQTAVAHQPTQKRAAQAGSTLVSRAGASPGGARLIPRQADGRTDRQTGPCSAHPSWQGGAPLNPRQTRWSMANPQAETGSGRCRQAGLPLAELWFRPETPGHVQLVVGQTDQTSPSRVSAGRGKARLGPAGREELTGPRPSQWGIFLPAEKSNAAISFPVQLGRGRAVGSKLAVAFRNYLNIRNRR